MRRNVLSAQGSSILCLHPSALGSSVRALCTEWFISVAFDLLLSEKTSVIEDGRAGCSDAHLQLSQALQTLLRCSDIGFNPESVDIDGSSARFFICCIDTVEEESLSAMR